ncbi:MAG: DUF2953 domain-containing protein [Lachnospiraceae bacterium]|nr:DUF2953 domain-containing protein [Lachnospiraceae bacterium]
MILSILKGIGCVIGIIVLVILLYIGIVCILPVRYEFDGDYHEQFDGGARIRYMPIGLRIAVSYHNQQFQYTVRLLGGVIMTNTGAKISWIGRKLFADEEKEEESSSVSEQNNDISGLEHVENMEQSTESHSSARASQEKKIQHTGDSHSEEECQNVQPDKRISVRQRIRDRIQHGKQRIRRIFQKGKQWNKKKDALLKIYHSRRFEVVKADVKGYIKQFFYIVKPQRLEGEVHFGFEDPAATGELLGVLACILPLYQNYLMIHPDFEKACFDGNLRGKGKIYLGAVLILLLKIVWNKNLIKVTKKVQTIIEA